MKRSTFIREAMPAAAVATMVGGSLLHSARAEVKSKTGADSDVEKNEHPMKEEIIEAREALKAHDEAFNNHDLEGVLATFADKEGVILMGTGPGEYWVGKQEIAEAYKQMFKGFDKGSQKFDYKFRYGGISSEMAYLTTAGLVTLTDQGEEHEFVLNTSLVAEKIDGAWKLVSLHYSNLTGDNIQTAEN